MEWKTEPLGDILELIIDNRGKTPPLSNSKSAYELLEINAIVHTTRSPNYDVVKKFVTKETYDTWFRKGHPVKGDILVPTVGSSIGDVAILDENRGAIAQNLIALRVNSNKIDSDYLFYLFKSPNTKSRIRNLDISSAQPSVKVPHLLNMDIKFPSNLQIQNKIAKVLGDLDKKIAINQQINQTLESMAQTLFKSWFIDFDPVKVKMAGRVPNGMDADLLALFPDSFEDSELGPIPKGWEIKKLGSVLTPKKGKVITKQTTQPGNVPVIAGGISPAYYHSTANVTAPVITVSASGNAGYTNLYHEDIWASDCSYINITQTPFVYSIYSFLKSRQTEIFSMQQGAVQPHVYPSDLMRIVMADAPKNIWKKCETIIASLYNKIGENILENKTLTETRDALLPKLLSGELSVNDVEA